MSFKDMKKTAWHRVQKRIYTARDVFIDARRGKKSLLTICALSSPLTVRYDFADVLIADVQYAWLQIALEGARAWLTAMFDEKGELIQIYFDITDGNLFTDTDNPCFDDMYLDVVLTPDESVHVVDEDELDAALSSGDITRLQYENAKDACQRLQEYLQKDAGHVISYCKSAYRELKKQEETCQ